MDKKEQVRLRLQKYIESGNSIIYKEMKKIDPNLLWDIYRHLGNIEKACKSIGMSNTYLKNKYGFNHSIESITEEELISRLGFLYSIEELKTKNLKSEGDYFNDNQVYNILNRKFKSIDEGLEYYGFENQYKWTEKRILKNLRHYEDKELSMSYQEMMLIDSNLVNAVRNRFSSYYKGLDYYGISYTRLYNVSSKENLLERLESIRKKFGTLNYSVIKKNDSAVLYYAYEKYGSLKDMLIQEGYSEYIESHPDVLIESGWKFEKVFCEILDYLGVEYGYNKKYGNYRPDFQLKNDVWIDVKLSSWTPSIQDTIDKYSNNCKKLIIVYMRGTDSMLKYYNIPENTEIVSVNEFINTLPEEKRMLINDKMQSIENNIKNTAS